MESKTYHHGDLRRLLIETGIEFIGKEGEEKLSLRKVAEQCGVSNAAPYAHFRNKNEFIGAIQEHIMGCFTTFLQETERKYAGSPSLLIMLGKAYVLFFLYNPFYYTFLFSQKNIQVILSSGNAKNGGNHPFEIFKSAAVQMFRKADMSEKMIQDKVIAMWALVHGLAAITAMPNVILDDNWELRIEDIIQSISVPYNNSQEGKI